MKNETFTPERIKAEADAFFEWDGEDRSLVTTTSCLLFAQHIAGLMQARAAQPAPVVQEGYVLVPVEPTEAMWGGLARDLMMWLDFGNPTVEALRKHLSMLGREWPAWMDGESEMKGSGVPSKGTRATLIYKAMLAAAPAQGQQVECDTCHGQGEVFIGDVQSFGYMSMQPPEPIMEVCPECSGESVQRQHPDDAAVDRFAEAMKAKLAKSRAKGRGGWEDKSLCSAEYLSELLRGHVDKGDPVDVANFCMMLRQRGEGIAAPAQGQQVECQECGRLRGDFEELAERYGKLQAGEDSLLAKVVTERDQAMAELSALKAHPEAYQFDGQVLRDEHGNYLAEFMAYEQSFIDRLLHPQPELKAQQVGQEPAGEVHLRTGGGISLLHVELAQSLPPGTKLYTAPQPAPAQDVAGLVEALERMKLTDKEARHHSPSTVSYWNNAVLACQGVVKDFAAAHEKQSGGEA